MKQFSILPAVFILILAACTYDSPITEEHSIPIDQALLGLWEPLSGDDQDPLLVLKLSDTEYQIHNFGRDSGIYFRGYAIEVEGVPAVQLQVLGDDYGPVDETAERRYSVVSYRLVNGELEVSELNTDLVDEDLETSEAIRQAFVVHKDNKDLFTDPILFRKIQGKRVTSNPTPTTNPITRLFGSPSKLPPDLILEATLTFSPK